MRLFQDIRACFFLLGLLLVTVQAKPQSAVQKKAEEYFKNQNFKSAIEQYKILIKNDPQNIDYHHKIAICYLNANVDRTKAIPHLEKIVNKENISPEVYLDLGIAYRYALKFDKAVEMLQKYQQTLPDSKKDKVEKLIKDCFSAKELVKYPLKVKFENLGDNINTEFPDYYPFISKDETMLVYTSRRNRNRGAVLEFDGYYPSDVWIAEGVKGIFNKAKNAGVMINSEYDEQCVGLSNDANTMFVYVDKVKEYGDIYISKKGSRSFMKIQKMGDIVNSPYIETAASISADGNTLFFASDRPDGQGGLDLWMTRKLPTGDWARPQNLGPAVNTPYNEDFPTLSEDGKTLYFCSEGHSGMGGYDIFKTEWEPETNTWGVPKNIGYPINTPYDERVISFNADGTVAYISAIRKEGKGDLDIYKVIFEDNVPAQAILKIKLTSSQNDTLVIKDAMVSIYDSMNELKGSYMPNPNTGEFLIILEKGEYSMEIEAPGFEFHVEDLKITNVEIKNSVVHRNLALKPE